MFILGSKSPRRKEILSYFRIPFEVHASNYDEEQVTRSQLPHEYVTQLAKNKAATFSLKKGDVVLTADTTVALGTALLGKPTSIDHAVEMLLALSGTTHKVVTGVCVRTYEAYFIAYETTDVSFISLTSEKARAYAQHFAVLDKAGAYAIQDGGAVLIKKIDGCFYNVMGLPLQTTTELLKKSGIDIWDHLGHS